MGGLRGRIPGAARTDKPSMENLTDIGNRIEAVLWFAFGAGFLLRARHPFQPDAGGELGCVSWHQGITIAVERSWEFVPAGILFLALAGVLAIALLR